MHRVVLPLLAGFGGLAVAACGSSAAAGTTTPKPGSSSTPRAGARAFNGAFGQLVQIKGQTLIVSNAQGDTTVAYTGSTTITQTSTATFADIVTGECLSAAGTKDSTGAVTATNVTVRNASNGSCSAGSIFGGPGGGAGNGGGTRTPNPNRTPNPSFAPAANLGRASGLVTAVNGTSVTVQDTTTSGTTTTTITVPTTVRVNRIDTVDSSALQTGECVTAVGQKDSSGTVQARALTIVPAGPNGCTPGGGGFFGGGRFGGGGGVLPGSAGGSGTGSTAA